ncbi:MAG TPA: hypothetical protein VK914_06240 [bacterium]|jgi:hypothetical protein|nr:hypothetical protein [bacterium]
MGDLVNQIEIGIVVSVVIAFFSLAIKALWEKYISDYYLEFTSRHVPSVSGSWQSIDAAKYTESVMTFTMHLKQYGWKLKGKIYYEEKGEKINVKKMLDLDGMIQGDILSIRFWNRNRHLKGGGTFTVVLVGNGTEMEGKYSWYNTGISKIDCGDIKWNRIYSQPNVQEIE